MTCTYVDDVDDLPYDVGHDMGFPEFVQACPHLLGPSRSVWRVRALGEGYVDPLNVMGLMTLTCG